MWPARATVGRQPPDVCGRSQGNTAPPLKFGPPPSYDLEWARTHGPVKVDHLGFKVMPLKHEEKAKPKPKRSGWLGGWL
jgi:hypothetical protein